MNIALIYVTAASYDFIALRTLSEISEREKRSTSENRQDSKQGLGSIGNESHTFGPVQGVDQIPQITHHIRIRGVACTLWIKSDIPLPLRVAV